MHYQTKHQLIKRFSLLLLIIGIYIVLVLLAIGKHHLWGDEASTAVSAISVLKNGIPIGWDGLNIYGARNGFYLSQSLIKIYEPWLEFYIAAVSIKLCGVSTVCARIPFMIFSLFTLYFVYKLAYKVSFSKRTALVTLLYLSISVSFLLYSYQARYYALSMFYSTALLLLCLDLLKKNYITIWTQINVAVTSILFLFSHELTFLVFVLSLIVATLFVFRSKLIHLTLKLFPSLIFILIVSTVWYLYQKYSLPKEAFFQPNFNFLNATVLLLRYVFDFHSIGFPLIPLFILLPFVLKKHHQKHREYLLFIYITCISDLIFLSILSPQPISITTRSDLRYAMNIYPLLALLGTYTLFSLFNKRSFLLLGVLMLYLLTDFLAIFSYPPNVRLFDYISEVYDKTYVSPITATVNYFKINTKPGDTVFVTPDYLADPLWFYFDKQLIYINRISPYNKRLLGANSWLPKYVYDADKPPDWMVFFSKRLQFESRPLPKTVNIKEYEEIKLPVYAFDLTHPELFLHTFHAVTDFPEIDSIFIYRHISPTQSQQLGV